MEKRATQAGRYDIFESFRVSDGRQVGSAPLRTALTPKRGKTTG
jgi:hypothetical protein